MIGVCDNCGAKVPNIGTASDGRKICCPHCVFNPEGCRCQYGEFGVKQEYVPYDDTGDDPVMEDWEEEE